MERAIAIFENMFRDENLSVCLNTDTPHRILCWAEFEWMDLVGENEIFPECKEHFLFLKIVTCHEFSTRSVQ